MPFRSGSAILALSVLTALFYNVNGLAGAKTLRRIVAVFNPGEFY